MNNRTHRIESACLARRVREMAAGLGPRLFVAFFAATASVRAEGDGLPLGAWYDIGVELLEVHVPEAVRGDYEFLRAADWRMFWDGIQGALASQDLEEMDRVLPYVAQGLELLRAVPGGRPYADWLQQRLDYFQVADEVVESIPRPVPLPPPPPPPVPPLERRPRVVPPPRPAPPPPPPPAVTKKRRETAGDRATWEKKMAGRPPPRHADDVIPGLKKIFREEGVPEQLVWLAEVESSLNPNARSPVGAVGLFQFMPATAQRFGMSTAPVDQRTDPQKSARAAAQYLRILHRQFDSWPLALAAYNAGEGRVGRLLKQSGEKTFESIQESLPMETRMYVPKVLAVISVREGVDGAQLPAPG